MSRVPSVGSLMPYGARPLPAARPSTPPVYQYGGATGAATGASQWRPPGVAPVNQPAAPTAPAPWSPSALPPAGGAVNVSSVLDSIYGGGGAGGGYGGAVVPVHNPQGNYFPYHNNGGVGFLGGTGWAGTGNNQGNAMQTGWAGDRAQEQVNPWLAAQSGGYSGAASTPQGALAQAYQEKQDGALARNEARYQDILAGHGNLIDRTRARLDGLGDQQKKDLADQYDANAGKINQSLVNRGMSNTTVMDNLQAGNLRDKANAQNRLQESLNREYIGYDSSLENNRLGFMERRQDPYPDLDQLIRLSQMMGAAGNGQGGSALGGLGGGMAAGAVPQNGFVAPGNFGVNFANGNGGGGGGGNNNGGLNPYQQMLLQQNMAKQQNQYGLSPAMMQQLMASRNSGGGWQPSQVNSNLSDYP